MSADVFDEYGISVQPAPEAEKDVFDEYGISAKPKYMSRPAETYGGDEKIVFGSEGITVDAPYGSTKILENALRDDSFDDHPSSIGEETAAVFEKQAANIAFFANAFGLVTADEVAPFIADRSRALQSAQERAPEYVKKFNRDYAAAEGAFQTTGVLLDNLPVLGRVAITQSPNSILPLLTTYAGTKTGAAVGGALGSAVPVAGTTAGAITGGVAGGAVGAFTGSSMSEIGSQLDELLLVSGYDTSDANSVRAALQDKELMADVTAKAVRKGITTAAIDGMFQIVGGHFIRTLGKTGTVSAKAKGAVADVAVQSFGEFSGEAAGQYARDGNVSYKDAVLEGVTSITQSVGQTAIGAAARGGKAVVKASTTQDDAVNFVAEVQAASEAETKAQDISETRVEGVPQEVVADIVSDFLGGVEPDTSQFSEAQEEAIQNILDNATPVRDKIIRGRIRTLDIAVESKLEQVDAAETEIEIAENEGRATKRLEERASRLTEEWEALDAERGELLAVENPATESADLLKKDITIKGEVLEKQNIQATKKTVMAVNAAFRKARVSAQQGIKNVQTLLSSAIKQSGLDVKSQSDFIGTIKNIQTAEQLKAQAPKIQARIEVKINETRKRNAISSIRSLLKRVAKSNVISIDYVNKINDLVNAINTRNMSPKTSERLNKTLKFVESGGVVPKAVLKTLEVLGKKKLSDISPSELEAMSDAIKGMIDIGRTKLKLMKAREQRVLKQRLSELSADSKPLSSVPLKRAPLGERLAAMDKVKNNFLSVANYLQRLNINKNPMDVIFDIMDGLKEYSGANHRIFKQTVDAGYSKFLDLKESITRPIKSLQDRLSLEPEQFQRIGVYAAWQQKGGEKKLLASGITQEEIDSLTLSPDEMAMYDLMRKQLDSMVPALREVMRVQYNKNFDEVENYFPFMTDFDAMTGYEIQDMFGDAVPLTTKKKNVEKGFTKTRTGGQQTIRIDALAVFMRHVDNASYLVGLGSDIKQLSDLASSDEFGVIAGDIGQNIVTDWLNLLARKGSLPDRVNFLDVFRRNTGAAILGFKLSSIFIQPTSLMDGAALVGGTYVARGVSNFTDPAWRKFLVDNMPEIRERGGDDPAYLDLGGDGVLKDARSAGYYAMQKVDLFSASSVAIGAYMKSVEERGGTVDLSKPDKKAIADAQLYMRRTQSASFAKDTAPVISQGKLTGNVSVDKLITQFQSFLFNRWSIIQHDMISAGLMKGKTVKAMNIAMWLTMANISEYFIRQWTKEMIALATGTEPPEEDDEKKTEKIIMQAVGNVPFVGSIVNSFQYGSVPIPSLSMLEKFAESVQYGNMSKSADKEARHYGGAALLASGLLGVPGALQVQQLYSGLMKEKSTGKEEEEGFTAN